MHRIIPDDAKEAEIMAAAERVHGQLWQPNLLEGNTLWRMLTAAARGLSGAGLAERQQQFLDEYLPSLDDVTRACWQQHRAGVKHAEIARSLGVTVEEVRRALARIYVDCRTGLYRS